MKTEYLGTCSYSPDDNKLRFDPFARLSKEDYGRITGTGFKWAPMQKQFIAPMWTPCREDLMIEWCGEIGDEDTSLIERAETRSERFEGYSENRLQDAESARAAVSAIADNIPLGQPILVGHHSERHARRDAEKIENGMRRAVKMWETSNYWQDRAAAAIRHAKYKELPDVRARRIKGIEADKRKQERSRAQAEQALRFWNGEMTLVNRTTGEKFTLDITEENRTKIRGLLGGVLGNTVGNFNVVRKENGASWEGWSAWNVLEPDETRYKACPSCTVQQCKDAALKVFPSWIAHYNRWITHYDNRLAYERAMLAEDGGLQGHKFNLATGGKVKIGRRGGEWYVIKKVNTRDGAVISLSVFGYFRTIQIEEVEDYQAPADGAFEAVKKASKLPPICNYRGSVTIAGRYGNEDHTAPIIEITQETWNRTCNDYKGTRLVKATEKAAAHRVRYGNFGKANGYSYCPVFITDAKEKLPPAPDKTEAPLNTELLRPDKALSRPITPQPPKQPDADAQAFSQMKDTLKAGVQVVSAPQLFPTPAELACRAVEMAGLMSGDRVLEPSAGTGNLIQAALEHGVFASDITAVEINSKLAGILAPKVKTVVCGDFLEQNGNLGKFDKIVMNPPFENGADIKHIQHAMKFLNPGGRLVAICANGPRQNAILKPIAEESGGVWEPLPAGSFAESGTNVNTALVVIESQEIVSDYKGVR